MANESKTIIFDKLPRTLAELQALPQAKLTDPFETAALAVAVLANYPKNKEETIKMLNFLGGPRELNAYDKQFLADRFRDKDYVPISFFAGTSPDNNYTPALPYTITIFENPYSRSQINEGYLQLFRQSSGADSPRHIKLRNKPSTGQWFLWEQMLLSDIRTPKEKDPWA